MSCGNDTPSRSALPKIRVVQTLAVRVPSPLGWVQVLKRMHNRWQQRQALLDLEDRLLDDIGITREQAEREARTPFWKRHRPGRGRLGRRPLPAWRFSDRRQRTRRNPMKWITREHVKVDRVACPWLI